MPTYIIRYELRKGSSSSSHSKTVTAETENIALQIVKTKASASKPDYDFLLKDVKVKDGIKKSYTITYQMKKNNSSSNSTRTVNAETEATALQMVKKQASINKPGYTFILKNIKTKN